MSTSSLESTAYAPIARTSVAPYVPADTAAMPPRLSHAMALRLGRWQAGRDLVSSLPLIAADAAMAWLAAEAAETIHVASGGGAHPLFIVGVVIMTLFFQQLHGLYPACGMTYNVEFRRILRTTVCVLSAVAFAMWTGRNVPEFPWLCFLTLAVTLPYFLAAARPVIRHWLKRYDWWTQPVVIVGNGGQGERLYRRLDGCRHEGIRPAGIVYDPARHWSGENDIRVDPPAGTADIDRDHPQVWSMRARIDDDGHVDWGHAAGESESPAVTETPCTPAPTDGRPLPASAYLAPVSQLDRVLTTQRACRIAVASPDVAAWQNVDTFRGVPHVMLPTSLLFDCTERGRLFRREDSIELHCDSALTKPHVLAAKRAMDLVIVIAAMPFWLPVMAGIALALKIWDPGPVFYTQVRVGRQRRPFRAMKFRSMVVNADRKLKEYLHDHPELKAEWEATHKLKKDPRITKIGRFLRKTSLDELPQLFNVLKGDMSLVGPRPIIDCGDYDLEYIREHADVFELYQMVRPGITGLWQVSGRNSTTYKHRVYCDRYYLHNWSLSLDLFILWRTIKTALLREGAC
ncbi:sugar transferase [Crateriforma spongiae]|uniref:sugar transferase n=1 Tax=Crateriforma spongiae TaxID=2724528 RepID=UPI0039AF0C8E